MAHPFLGALAAGLAERAIATLRYQFLYMEQRSKRPDPPNVAHAAVRAGVAGGVEEMAIGNDLPRHGAGRDALLGHLGDEHVGPPFQHFRDRRPDRERPEVTHRARPGCGG